MSDPKTQEQRSVLNTRNTRAAREHKYTRRERKPPVLDPFMRRHASARVHRTRACEKQRSTLQTNN